MSQTSGGLVIPDFVLARLDLQPGAKLLYSALCRCADEAGDCSPSQKSLALWIGQSTRSVRNHLIGLAEVGLIQVIPSEQGKTPIYRLLIRPVEAQTKRFSCRIHQKIKSLHKKRTGRSSKRYQMQ